MLGASFLGDETLVVYSQPREVDLRQYVTPLATRLLKVETVTMGLPCTGDFMLPESLRRTCSVIVTDNLTKH